LRWVGAGLTIHSGGVPAGKGNDMTLNPIRRAIRATAFVGALAAGLATASTTAQALSITFSDTLSSNSASVQKFDPSLGTLNFLRIGYDLRVNLSSFFRNASATPGTTTLAPNSLRLEGPGPSLGSSGLPDQLLAGQSIGGDFTIQPALVFGSTTITTTTVLDFGYDYQITRDSRGISLGSLTFLDFDKNLFVGPGTFDFGFDASLDSPLTFTGFQPFLGAGSPFVTGTMTVTYDYTEAVAEIPTPAALPLLAAGLAAFGLMRRRTKG